MDSPAIIASPISSTAVVMSGLVALLGYYMWSLRKPQGSPPGPASVPIIGNTILGENTSMKDFCELAKTYGKIYSMYVGKTFVVVLNDYESVKEALVTHGITTGGRQKTNAILSYNPGFPHTLGVIDASYSEEWKHQRNCTLNILRSLGYGKSSLEIRIKNECDVLQEALIKTNGEAYDPADLIGVSVANIICSMLFGKRFEHDDEVFKELLHALSDLFHHFQTTLSSDSVPLLKLIPSIRENNRKLFQSGAKLKAFYNSKIAEARERLKNDSDPKDFTALYIKEVENAKIGQTSKISEDWTIQVLNDFFMAGAETTATTLKWAMIYMASHPEVQARVQTELDNVFGKGPCDISLSDRSKLPYTEATIAEIQRISTIAPLAVPHEAMADVTLCGYRVHKGTVIWPNLYEILHDAKIWPDPEVLKPQRFLDAEGKFYRPEHWIPFGMGRRVCLGEQLAKQELFLFFSQIVKGFQIKLATDNTKANLEPLLRLVLTPNPYKIRFVPRS